MVPAGISAVLLIHVAAVVFRVAIRVWRGLLCGYVAPSACLSGTRGSDRVQKEPLGCDSACFGFRYSAVFCFQETLHSV